MNADEKKQIEEIVRDATTRLLEHFDSVRIFVTIHRGERDTTFAHSAGGGNVYAQLGQVQDWLSCQDERSRSDIRKDNDEE